MVDSSSGSPFRPAFLSTLCERLFEDVYRREMGDEPLVNRAPGWSSGATRPDGGLRVEIPLPEQMSPEQWEHVTYTLILLWSFAGLMILGAGAMLVAHIVVPSLIDKRDIDEKYGKGRPFAYAIAVLAFAGAIFVFASFVIALQEFQDIYPGYWI